MKSPFPGMDPYLEAHWGDVHTSLMVYARNEINAQLPGDLQARVEEGLAVEVDEETRRTIYPDIRVVEEPDVPSSESEVATVSVAEPFVLVLEDESRTQRHIEIVDLRDAGRVITAIEVLSPANKSGDPGRQNYRRKQEHYLEAKINLVEIDLIREGRFILAAPEQRIPAAYRTPYLICIRRAASSNRAEIYSAPLREPLPAIPIPLRPSDRDVVLQLQPLIDACYRDGRYNRINYQAEPVPRLGEADAYWADALLRAGRLR